MDTGHWSILSIEDDKDVQELYNEAFQAAGLSIYLVYDGQEALNFLDSGNTFDVAIIDIMLPNVSGYEVLNRIRLQPDHQPIIVLSAIADEGDSFTGLTPGKVVYIRKGAVPLSEIAKKINEFVEGKFKESQP